MLPLEVVVRVADWGRQEKTKEMVADVKEGRSRKTMKSTHIWPLAISQVTCLFIHFHGTCMY